MLASPNTARTAAVVNTRELTYKPEERTFYGWGSQLFGYDPTSTRILMVESEKTGHVERFDRMPGAEGERERVYASRSGLVVVLHVVEW